MYCDKCGAKVEADANFCDVCGEVLKENKSGKIDKFIFVEDKKEETEFLDADEENAKEEVKSNSSNSGNKTVVIISISILVLSVLSLAFIGVYTKVEGNISSEKESGVIESSTNTVSEDWTETEFSMAGIKYKLNTSYRNFEKNNWTINGNAFNNGLTLIKNDKTSVSLSVVNKDFDSDVKVGIINLKDKRREMLDCETWGITVNNEHATNPVTFKLAKGITNGSTKEDIIKAYGELSADKIKTLDDRVILQYQKDYSVYLDLTIINDKGLTSFSYKKY